MVNDCKQPPSRKLWETTIRVLTALVAIAVLYCVVESGNIIDDFSLTLSEYTRMMKVTLPDSAKVLTRSYEQEFGGRLYFLTVAMDRGDVPEFLRSSPFVGTRLAPENPSVQHSWLKHGGRTLETAQVELSRSEFLEIGVRTGDSERVTVFLVLSSGR